MTRGSPFKADFPLFAREENADYVYFDSAATTLKPASVIRAVANYHETVTSNVHRSIHVHAEASTIAFEGVREGVAHFIRCDRSEVVFTHNCTDAINVAADLLDLDPDDEIIVTRLEHHSNFLPWCGRAKVRMIGVNKEGVVNLEQLVAAIGPRTRLVAVAYVSNVTGNVQPVAEVVRIAREHGIPTLVDGAQAVGHFPVDMAALGCDFFCFSAHKMLGPSGVGVLYVRQEVQGRLHPRRLGGGMVNMVSTDSFTMKQPPYCYEAGTPNIEGVIGFGRALEWFATRGFGPIGEHLDDLERYFRGRLADCTLIRPAFPFAERHLGIFSFVPARKSIDLNHFGRILSDSWQIALSVGVQCCQPYYQHHGLDGALRASLYVYNTRDDVDRFFEAIESISMFL
jgi:cysteine desulfurase/selenocysteine lyase